MNAHKAKQYNPQENLAGELQAQNTLPWLVDINGSKYISLKALAFGVAASLVVWWLW